MSATNATRLPHFLVLALLGAVAGCTPRIGDHCALSTDCSLRGDRQCDNSQPNGYCTEFNCAPNSCPDQAACVMFGASVPGCPYDDYRSPSRTARAFCMAHCQQDSDCRQSEGYICRNPTDPRWNALILDDNQSEKVCISAPDYTYPDAAGVDTAICSPKGPPVPPYEAGVNVADARAGADAGAGADASADAGADADMDADASASADAIADAGLGADAGTDAPGDGARDAADAGPADAPSGQ
jgi:hypothetical protein